MPKTIPIIECRNCNGSYYAGTQKLVLNPGSENELPDELYFSIRKIGLCMGCKERENRTKGGSHKRLER